MIIFNFKIKMINCFKKFNLSSTTSVLKKYTISHKITLTQISAFCTLNYKNYDYGFKEVKFGPKKTRVIVNYNGNSFKLEEVNKVTNKDFLESFSKDKFAFSFFNPRSRISNNSESEREFNL